MLVPSHSDVAAEAAIIVILVISETARAHSDPDPFYIPIHCTHACCWLVTENMACSTKVMPKQEISFNIWWALHKRDYWLPKLVETLAPELWKIHVKPSTNPHHTRNRNIRGATWTVMVCQRWNGLLARPLLLGLSIASKVAICVSHQMKCGLVRNASHRPTTMKRREALACPLTWKTNPTYLHAKCVNICLESEGDRKIKWQTCQQHI